jgi:valyl-tRNA synthetase
VAVHPDDDRYKHLLGELVELPLTGRRIPVIADDYVDPEFGTGCVKITPAHDFNDYQVWLRHRDEQPIAEQPHGGLINIFTASAAVRGNEPAEGALVPEAYAGLDRFEARRRIVADLDAAGLLERTDDHRLMVPRGDRSGAVIEPFLTDQWYVRVGPLAKAATEAVGAGRIRFVPDNWKNTFFDWMHNIQDWCISRQIWWGHRIPAWYDPQGNIYVGRSEAEVRDRHGLAQDYPLTRDEDVLDTWFSSALWPFSTLGWPDDTERLATFYPTSVLVTGFDIIFFWVARMIMMGVEFMKDVPFRDVYVTGLIRDAHGNKMSKSKGNILDPIDLVDGIDLDALVAKRTRGLMQPHLAEKIAAQTRREFPEGIPALGTDALRFTLAALASTGRDINFDLGRAEGYRNFCNKLWNAARYVLMRAEGEDCGQDGGERELSAADRWIGTRLQAAIRGVTEAMEGYRFDLAAQTLYQFVWSEYCDWYLELSKPVLNDPEAPEAARRGTRATLVETLETLLRLAHPVMPFITEEIWQRVGPLAGRGGETVMLAPYPVADPALEDTAAVAEMGWVMELILGIRRIRGEMGIPPARPLPVLLQHAGAQEREWLARNRGALDFLARVESVEVLAPDAEAPEAAVALVGAAKVLIPLADVIDKDAELARLDKELGRLRKDLERSEGKLANPSFVDRAPAPVVEKERARLAELREAEGKLRQQHARIAAL